MDKAWKVLASVNNVSRHTFLGQYWILCLKVEDKKGKRTCHFVPLPPTLGPKDAFDAVLPLPAEADIGRVTKMCADLFFSCQRDEPKAFCKRNLTSAALGPLSLVDSAGSPRFPHVPHHFFVGEFLMP